ncbi:MAG: nascent polypeptide-associated complex protein [Halodesulfurarchaeum sp.]
MFGGGGMNPRKMEQMMEQMGIDMEELEATEVSITLADGTKLSFADPEVTRMNAKGQETYQIVGEAEAVEAESEGDGDGPAEPEIPESDVELVAERTGVSASRARKAIEDADGDLAAAIADLE